MRKKCPNIVAREWIQATNEYPREQYVNVKHIMNSKSEIVRFRKFNFLEVLAVSRVGNHSHSEVGSSSNGKHRLWKEWFGLTREIQRFIGKVTKRNDSKTLKG